MDPGYCAGAQPRAWRPLTNRPVYHTVNFDEDSESAHASWQLIPGGLFANTSALLGRPAAGRQPKKGTGNKCCNPALGSDAAGSNGQGGHGVPAGAHQRVGGAVPGPTRHHFAATQTAIPDGQLQHPQQQEQPGHVQAAAAAPVPMSHAAALDSGDADAQDGAAERVEAEDFGEKRLLGVKRVEQGPHAGSYSVRVKVPCGASAAGPADRMLHLGHFRSVLEAARTRDLAHLVLHRCQLGGAGLNCSPNCYSQEEVLQMACSLAASACVPWNAAELQEQALANAARLGIAPPGAAAAPAPARGAGQVGTGQVSPGAKPATGGGPDRAAAPSCAAAAPLPAVPAQAAAGTAPPAGAASPPPAMAGCAGTGGVTRLLGLRKRPRLYSVYYLQGVTRARGDDRVVYDVDPTGGAGRSEQNGEAAGQAHMGGKVAGAPGAAESEQRAKQQGKSKSKGKGAACDPVRPLILSALLPKLSGFVPPLPPGHWRLRRALQQPELRRPEAEGGAGGSGPGPSRAGNGPASAGGERVAPGAEPADAAEAARSGKSTEKHEAQPLCNGADIDSQEQERPPAAKRHRQGSGAWPSGEAPDVGVSGAPVGHAGPGANGACQQRSEQDAPGSQNLCNRPRTGVGCGAGLREARPAGPHAAVPGLVGVCYAPEDGLQLGDGGDSGGGDGGGGGFCAVVPVGPMTWHAEPHASAEAAASYYDQVCLGLLGPAVVSHINRHPAAHSTADCQRAVARLVSLGLQPPAAAAEARVRALEAGCTPAPPLSASELQEARGHSAAVSVELGRSGPSGSPGQLGSGARPGRRLMLAPPDMRLGVGPGLGRGFAGTVAPGNGAGPSVRCS